MDIMYRMIACLSHTTKLILSKKRANNHFIFILFPFFCFHSPSFLSTFYSSLQTFAVFIYFFPLFSVIVVFDFQPVSTFSQMLFGSNHQLLSRSAFLPFSTCFPSNSYMD